MRERFSVYGLDSLKATGFIADVGAVLGRTLSPTLAWEYPTLDALARHLVGARDAGVASSRPHVAREQEPIAIVGLACRLPQAPNPEAFWRLLVNGTHAITEVPPDRWDVNRLYDADPSTPGKVISRWGGYLESVDGFDPLFFGISPKEALHMDPQQRLMLELTWEALEDAGIPADRLQGSATAVCFGAAWMDYEMMLQRLGLRRISSYTSTGYHHSVLSNRVSYVLGLRGPSFSIDSACSSSLTAVHLACESLRRGESTLALVGGVNLTLAPESTVALSKLGALSPDGHCYTFDARANGFVRGEGAGVAVLKPLSLALADGDALYCVIRGGAINNNGGSNGLTAPNPKAQAEVIRRACERAGVDPAEVQYVEAHGTGTQLGDPLEAQALGEVLGAGRPSGKPLRIGSCKTNIGHLEAAAGITGLIKTALCIKHRALPASLHFETPNPLITFESLGLTVQRAVGEWPEPDRKLLAGVSSFGFGGANCHMVLEEADVPRAEPVHLSGETAEDLRAAALRLLERTLAPEHLSLADLLRAAEADGREHPHRLALTVRTRKDLRAGLEAFLAGALRPGVATGVVEPASSRKPVFVFSGHGCQWPRMGLALLPVEPAFRATLLRCDRLIQQSEGWSLLEVLRAEDASQRLNHIDIALPAIVSVEMALTELWRSWGIEPAAVVGHSIGEVSAAYAAGVLDLEDAIRVVCAEARVMGQLRGQGGLVVVGVPWAEAAELLVGYEGRLFRAIDSGADATVLSGDVDALNAVLATLQARGVFCRQVEIDVPVHCPRMDVLAPELREALRDLRPRPARVPLISSITGAPLDGMSADAAHWVKNIAWPTLFTGALSHAIQQGHDTFLEISPHAILRHPIEVTLRHLGCQGRVVASMRRQEDERGTLLDTLGVLYTRGAPVPWDALGTGRRPRDTVPGPVRVLPLSARSPEALEALAADWWGVLEASGQGGPALEDLTYTAGVRRGHLSHRLSVVGSSRQEFAEALEAFTRGEPHSCVRQGQVSPEGRAKVAFVFPGQGSQWLGMGRQLLRDEPVFRSAIEACERAMRPHVAWSLAEELLAEESRSRLQDIDVVQPVLFAVQVALAALWRSWGIAPDAVVGHSMGEVAAAHVAGALSLSDAARIICLRSQLLRCKSGQGAMAVVELGLEQARAALEGFESRLSVAVSNSARSTVLSGDTEALDVLLPRLEAEGVFCRRVKVNVASHSPQMDGLKEDLLRVLDGVAPVAAPVPICSTVTGQVSDGAGFHAVYWVSNLREPVLFHGAVEQLLADGFSVFVEMSPHPVLLAPIDETLRASRRDALVVASLRRQSDERRSLLESLGALYAWGCSVDWTALHPAGGNVVALPRYPWQRERFWLPDEAERDAVPLADRQGHPLIGRSLDSSVQPGTWFWEQTVSVAAFPYLTDHVVGGDVVFPGAGYVEMALGAGAEVLGEAGLVLEDVSLSEMLAFASGEARRVQVVLKEESPGHATFQISSRLEGEKVWRKHAAGSLRREARADETHSVETPDTLWTRLTVPLSAETHYHRRREQGLQYGPTFQGLRGIWRTEDEALGRLEVSDAIAAESEAYRLHPALLDAGLQVALELLNPLAGGAVSSTYVPVGLGRVRYFHRPGRSAWARVKARGEGEAGARERSFDCWLLDEEGRVLMSLEGLRLYRLDAGASARKELGEWLYQVDWEERSLPAVLTWPERTPGSWLILGDRGGVGQRLSTELRARGETCVLVTPGEAYRFLGAGGAEVDPNNAEHWRRLLGDGVGVGVPPCRGVVHLWSLDIASNDTLTGEALGAARRLGTTSVLHLVQALTGAGWRDAPRLWLATRGARSVGVPAEHVAVAQAPLLGLGQVLAVEHPELRCTRVDLEGGVDVAADALLREVSSTTFEDQTAWRGGARRVARLSRAPECLSLREPSTLFRPDGTYLITGGLGGLGLELARWLVAHGARHLLLMGRRAPGVEAEQALTALREAGARVECFQADVSRPEDVARALAHVATGMRPLKGVFHAAGLLDDGLLLNLTDARFASVSAPKVEGSWNLHSQTRHLPLEHFVLFSSVAASLGTPGQANYASANAFMDALAQARTAEGLPALSINWGTWTRVGLAAAQANRGERLEARGLGGMPPDKALTVLGMLMGQERPHLSVMAFEPRQWLGFYLSAAQSPYFTRLAQEAATRAPAISGRGKLREQLDTARGSERRGLLDAHLRELIGAVLRMPPARIDSRTPLVTFGLDSLMSMEIRNRLEAALGLKLSATVVWTYPTVAALAPFLAEKLGLSLEDTPPEAAPPPAPRAGATASAIDDLSEDEVERLFAQRMARGS